MRGFHGGGGKLGATGDFFGQTAADMARHQRTHRFAQRAIAQRLFDVGKLGIKALRITDGEFQLVLMGDADQIIGFVQLNGDGFFQKHVLASQQRLARHRVVQHFGRGGNNDGVHVVACENCLVIGTGGGGIGFPGDFGQTFRARLHHVQVLDQWIHRAGFSAYTAAPAGADNAYIDLLH